MKRPPKNPEERKAFTGWRYVEFWRPGQLKAIKRRHNRRVRREQRAQLRRGRGDVL